jgi:hypothetical protein
VSHLRGAAVTVDPRRAARVLAGAGVVVLAGLVAAFYWAGADHNARIHRLHRHGVPVTATVTGCLGLLGGSGSNPAGYTCRGTFVLDGRRYVEGLPGNTLRGPGTRLRLVTVPGDPAVLDTPATVAREHPSAAVYILPSCLLAVLVAAVTTLAVARRRRVAGAGP